MADPRTSVRDALAAAERNRAAMRKREEERSAAAMAKLEERDRAANPQDYPTQPTASAERPKSVAETSVSGGAAVRKRAKDEAARLDSGWGVRSTPNKMYEPTSDFIDEKRRILGEQPQVLDAQQSAENQAAADLVAHTDEVAARTRDARIDTQAKAFVQAEEVAAALEARRTAQTAVKQATDDFQRAKEINPEGFWQSRTKGQKALAIIGAALARFGGQDMIPALQNAAREHTEATKANLAKRERLVGMREGEARDAAEIYQLTLEKVGDARVADLAMERAWMADAAAQWDRLAAQAGARALAPEQQAQRLALDEAIATMDLQIDQLAATNVKAFKQRVDLLGKETRRAARKQIDADIKLGADLTTSAVDQAGRLEIEGAKAGAEAAKAAREGEQKIMRGEGGVYREAKDFASKTEASQAFVAQIDDVLGQDDIAGYEWTASPLPDAIAPDAKTMTAKLRAIKETLGRMQSQGAITTDELETFKEMVEGGTALGGESRLRENLKILRRMAETRIEPHERALSPEARDFVRRNRNLPDFEPQHTGGSDLPVVTED